MKDAVEHRVNIVLTLSNDGAISPTCVCDGERLCGFN
jgi:hypothetical protein